MSEIVQEVVAREAARLEDTKRQNADRELLLALAPDKWRELKAALTRECAELTAASHRFHFRCDAPDERTFHVHRELDHGSVVAVAFVFQAAVPRIVHTDLWNGTEPQALDLILNGRQAFFTQGRNGIVLPHFLMGLMLRITRH